MSHGRFQRWFLLIGGCVLGWTVMVLLNDLEFVPVFHFVFGWVPYLGRVLPKVRLDFGGWIVFVVAFMVALLCLHSVAKWWLQWLDQQNGLISKTGSSEPATEIKPRWSVRASAATLLIFLLMFAIGISMSAIVHQLGWIANGPSLKTSSTVQTDQDAELSNYRNYPTPAGESWITAIFNYIPHMLPGELKEDERFDSEFNSKNFRGILFSSRCPSSAGPIVNSQGFGLAHVAANPAALGSKLSELRQNAWMLGEVNAGYDPWGSPTNVREPARGFRKMWGESDRGRVGYGSSHTLGANIANVDASVSYVNFGIDPSVLKNLSDAKIELKDEE